MPTKKTEIILIATYQDISLNQILKKGPAKKIDDFLKTKEKTLKRKKRLINISKRKLSIDKSKTKKVIISTLDHFGEERLPTLTPEIKVLTPATKKVDVTIINVDAYCATCKLKRARVFTVSIRDLEYQTEKVTRTEIDTKNVIPEKY